MNKKGSSKSCIFIFIFLFTGCTIFGDTSQTLYTLYSLLQDGGSNLATLGMSYKYTTLFSLGYVLSVCTYF